MSERLGEALLDLKTDDKGFRRGVDQAERHAQGLGRRLDDTARRALALGRTLALGAAAGATAIGALVVKVANDIATLKAEAETAGVDFEEFQRLRYAAEQNLVSVEALTDGLKELNLRADEFVVTGQGSAAEAFQRLGFSADELKTKLANPSALFTEIIDRLSQLNAASQIRIADEIFGGTGGEQFVRLMKDGAAGIEALKDRADELGIVVSSDTAAAADRFNGTIKTLQGAARNLGMEIAEQLLPDINAFADKLADPAFIENAKALASGVVAAFNLIIDVIEKVVAGMRWVGETLDWLATHDLFGNPLKQPGLSDEEFEARFNPPLAGKTDRLPKAPPKNENVGNFGDLSHIDRGGEVSELERQRQAVKDLIAQLETERDILRETDPVQRQMIALRKTLAAATPEQTEAVRELIAEMEREREALETNREAAEFYGRAIYDALVDLSEPGADAIDIIKRLGIALADAVLQATLLGQGPLAGIFGMKGTDGQAGGLLGQLFSGFFAKGGLIPSGTFGIVGERGPEPVISTSRGAMVLPNSSLSQAASAGGATQFTARLIMPEGWRAEIVDEARQGAGQDTVQIVQEFEAARENRWQNGAAR